MSKKYIGQVDNHSFVFPNNNLAEYATEIVHDINNNSVSGTISGVTMTFSGSNVNLTFSYTWNKNNAEPFIDSADRLHLLSVHVMDPSKKYFKAWRMADYFTTTNVTATTVSNTVTVSISPSLMQVPTLQDGIFNVEFRFIGHRAIYPICQNVTVAPPPSPTPTPTVSPGTIQVTPSPTATIAPTKTPTPTPTATSGYVPPIYTHYLGYDASSGWVACSEWSEFNRINLYSYTPASGLTNGTILYKTYAEPLTDYANNGWYSDGTNFYVIYGAGAAYYQTPCSTPIPTPQPTPTPSLAPVGYGVYTGATFYSAASACDDANYPNITVYIGPGDVISDGDVVYSDYALTAAFAGNDNFYRIRRGSSVYAARISGGGYISSLTSC